MHKKNNKRRCKSLPSLGPNLLIPSPPVSQAQIFLFFRHDAGRPKSGDNVCVLSSTALQHPVYAKHNIQNTPRANDHTRKCYTTLHRADTSPA